MINFLNDGKANNPEAAARNVRAKREADEAGWLSYYTGTSKAQVYRKGI